MLKLKTIIVSFVTGVLCLFQTGVGYTSPDCGLYQYRAKIIRVVDGDTVRADIDLGFNTWRRNEALRLDGIDAPEPKGATREAGKASTAALTERVEGKELTICTIKDKAGKYGRYLVRLYLGDEDINTWMIKAGYAVPY